MKYYEKIFLIVSNILFDLSDVVLDISLVCVWDGAFGVVQQNWQLQKKFHSCQFSYDYLFWDYYTRSPLSVQH